LQIIVFSCSTAIGPECAGRDFSSLLLVAAFFLAFFATVFVSLGRGYFGFAHTKVTVFSDSVKTFCLVEARKDLQSLLFGDKKKKLTSFSAPSGHAS
jgi:hypothetical protein